MSGLESQSKYPEGWWTDERLVGQAGGAMSWLCRIIRAGSHTEEHSQDRRTHGKHKENFRLYSIRSSKLFVCNYFDNLKSALHVLDINRL